MTDHKPLIYLFSLKDPSSRLLKFRLALEEYDFKILYVPGKNNCVADALSRILTSDSLKEMNNEIITVMTRAQRRKNDEQPDSHISNKSTNDWPDQPRVVELLKMPSDFVELSFISKDQLDRLRKN